VPASEAVFVSAVKAANSLALSSLVKQFGICLDEGS